MSSYCSWFYGETFFNKPAWCEEPEILLCSSRYGIRLKCQKNICRADWSTSSLFHAFLYPMDYKLYRHQSKMSSYKKLTFKGTLRQVFIRVYTVDWRYSQSCWYFRPSFVNCYTSSLLSGSTLPPPPFPVWISILYTHIQCVRGAGVWDSGPQTDKQLRQFFKWRHFALHFMCHIFLRCTPI